MHRTDESLEEERLMHVTLKVSNLNDPGWANAESVTRGRWCREETAHLQKMIKWQFALCAGRT